MATIEDIMLTISAKDNASSVFKGVGSNAESMASTASRALNSMSTGFMNLNQVSSSVMSSLSNGKSASELLLGTTSKAETNSVLVDLMSSTEAAAEKLNKHVDEVTNSSLVSMQNLIPALNAFKSATGATDDQIFNATDNIANFGAKVLAQTGSVEQSEQAMMDLSKGIKGACASLDQYGITVDALKNTGLWNGDENDIQGYMAAVRQLTGDTTALMETNEGLDARLGKAFSSAGKKIGNEFLPQLKDAKKAFLDLNSATGGDLAASIIVAAEGVDIFSQGMMFASETAQGIKGIKDGFLAVKDGVSIATEWLNKFRAAEEAAAAAMDMVQYTDAIGPLAPTTDISDDVFKIQEITPEIEQAAMHGSGFGYNADNVLEEIEKYADNAKVTEKQGVTLLEEASESNKLLNAKKLEAISEWESMVKETNSAAEVIDDVGDMGDLVKVTETTEEVVESASSMGKVGPKASAAGASMQASSGGLSAISAGAASMLVPLLSIAVVVAVMIPVVAALAAEAILCMKGLQLLVDAMDFGSVELDDDLDGIKKLGDVLLNIGIVMGEMTFASIMTGISLWVSGLGLIVNPIQLAVNQIKNVVPIINQLATVENIDESIPGKLERLGSSLGNIANATKAMTSATIDTGWGNFVAGIFHFSSTTDAISQAKKDIVKAAEQINQLKDLPELDEGVANKLESVGKSLSGVSDAIGALRSIRNDQNWDNIFSWGAKIQTTLGQVKQDIMKAADSIKNFGDLPEIPPDIGSKLSNIGDSLKGVSTSISALRTLRDDTNWDNTFSWGANIQTTLGQAKNTLTQAANQLRSFTQLPDIPEGISTKVARIGDATKSVGNGIKAMQDAKIPDTSILNGLPPLISAAKKAIMSSAESLKDFNESIPDVSEDMSKVTRVGDSTKSVGNAIRAMLDANIPDVSVLNQFPSRISAAKTVLQNTSRELNALTTVAEIPEGLYTKVSRVGTSAQNVGTSVSAIRSIPQIDPGVSMKVKLAVDAVRKTATELSKLNGANVADVGGVLNSVRNAMNQLRATLASMGGSFQASSQAIGAGIKAGVVAGMAGMAGDVNAQASSAVAMFTATMTAGGTAAGNGARTAFQGSFKLAAIASAEMSYAVQAVNSGAGALADACRRAAEEAVAAAKDGAESHSPGAIARMWGQEIGEYSVQKVQAGARLLISTVKSVSQNVVSAWGSPSLNLGTNMAGVNPSNISNMSLLSKAMPVMTGAGKIINFNIMSGAFKLDARNLTQRECQKIVTLGLEGITQVQDVNIRGI